VTVAMPTASKALFTSAHSFTTVEHHLRWITAHIAKELSRNSSRMFLREL